MVVASITSRLQRRKLKTAGKNDGFALPIAIALGFVMLSFAGLSVMVAQSDRNSAAQRQTSSASILVSDSAMARVLLQLSNPNNGALLNRNYDPINPKTGSNYLGADGAPLSGDETATAIDEWAGYNPSVNPCYQQLGWSVPNLALTGTLGSKETYTILAYRYDKQKRTGTVLVEGNYKNITSRVLVSMTIEPAMDNFPGVLVIDNWHNDSAGKLVLRGRSIEGNQGNTYYPPWPSSNPALTGISAPGDATRPSYLDAIYSGSSDGATKDTVAGKMFACGLTPTIAPTPQGPNLGVITTSQTLVGAAGNISYYQVDGINLTGFQTLTVDTTAGPVYIFYNGPIRLKNSAKIINIRTDGQPPKVGDLRLMSSNWTPQPEVRLQDQTCIQNAFLYNRYDDLELLTSAAGCAGTNANFVGVAWVEGVISSKNAVSNRDVYYWGDDAEELSSVLTITGTLVPGTSGISIPDDLSSLVDLIDQINLPVRYKYTSIRNWQRLK